MSQPVISVHDLTKDYGQGRGIFNLTFEVQRGEVFGFLGTNGSGKTTTIRHMMGFVKPDSGTVRVEGIDPWKHAPLVMQHTNYIPGEIAFPSAKTGMDFLRDQASYLGVHDFSRTNELLDRMALDATANLKRMSKGMKQKTAIVAAFMAPREIYLLDEPSTGLDPLMRETFLELVKEEHAKGATVFMSSHIFEELEDVCDRVAIINNGHIDDIVTLRDLRARAPRRFTITLGSNQEAESLAKAMPGAVAQGAIVTCECDACAMNELFGALEPLSVVKLEETHVNLEQYFMSLYKKEKE